MFVCDMSWPWLWTGRAWNDYAWKLREDGIRVIGWALTLTLGLSTVAHVATFIWVWANGSDGLTSFYRDRYGDLSGSFRAMFVGDMAPLGYLMFAMVSVWGWSTSVSWRKASAPIDWVSAGRTEEIDYEVVSPRPTDLLRLSDRSSRK